MPKPCEEEAVLLAKRLVYHPTMGQMERIRKALVEAEERGRRLERDEHWERRVREKEIRARKNK